MNRTPSQTNKHYDLNIPNALLFMKKNAYADTTIKAVGKRLRHLQKHCNLHDPENAKTYIAHKTCTNAYKETLIEAYDILMRSVTQQWNKPFYKRSHKLPKIPTTEKLDMLIARARPPMALFLSMSKDLGTRPVELTWLQVKDIDLKTGMVNITSAKHCNARALKLRPKTLDMLKQYIVKKGLNQKGRLFPTNPDYIGDSYRRLRNELAEKLQDPTIKQIRLYDFRHYYASMLYHKTKDFLFVKVKLGHRDLRQTLMYTQLVEAMQNDEYHCKTATNIKEATQLIEAGFEYVTELEGMKLFRKRK